METLKKQYLFWDVDLKKIDPEKNKKFIISRILSRGDLDDFRWAVANYGKEIIKTVIVGNRILDNKSQNFWQFYFNINSRECTKNQSTKKQSLFWRK